MSKKLVCLLGFMSFLAASTFAAVWRVDLDNVSGVEDGSTWPTAYNTIQEGVDAANAAGGGEVWVAEGTYTAATDPVLTMRNNVQLYGGFIGIGAGGNETSRDQRDWTTHVVTIDGQNARRCVINANNTVFDGVTVTRGMRGLDAGAGMRNDGVSATIQNCIFSSNVGTDGVRLAVGGGMFNANSTLTIASCSFIGNTAEGGGGMYNYRAGTITVSDCAFAGNLGRIGWWRQQNGHGGAMMNNSNSVPSGDLAVNVVRCVFSENEANTLGGGIYSSAGAGTVTLSVMDCTFERNWTKNVYGNLSEGGAIGSYYRCDVTIENCVFVGNHADPSATPPRGGAVAVRNPASPPSPWGTTTVTNCVFRGNAAGIGGAVYSQESSPTITNCTFWANTASTSGAGLYCVNASSATATNCIFWDSATNDVVKVDTSTAAVSYSDVRDGYAGTGNINADPVFEDAVGGDLHLTAASPCIDAGTTGPADDIEGISRPQGAGWDMGAYEFGGLVVSSVVRKDPNPTKSLRVGFIVTFSEPVTGVDVTDFALTTTGVSGAYVYSVSGTGATRTVTVATGTGSGTLRLDVVDDDTIVNSALEPLGGVGLGNGDYKKGETYTVDRTRPTVSLWSTAASRTNLSPIPVVVTFSEPVTGFEAIDVTPVNATVSNFAGSGAAYTFDLVPVHDGTVTARVLAGVCRDVVGNVNTASNLLTRTYDGTPPAVLSVVRTSLNPTRATSVLYRVTFSEAVTGVDATDFALTTTGVSGAYAHSVSGTGAVYTVRVATGTGSGTIRLDVVDDDSIKDGATNPLGGAGAGNGNFTSGEVYTVDKTRPTVSMSSTASNPTNVSPIPVTVTFSEPVTGFVAADIVPTNASVSNFAGSGANYTFDLVPGVPGTVRAYIPGGRAQDAVGNTNTASPIFVRTYQP